MKSFKIFYLSIIGMMFFTACEKEISPPAQNGNQIVVSCFISAADANIQATVRLSKPHYGIVYGGRASEISNAEVIISNTKGGRLMLTWDNSTKIYTVPAGNFLQVGQTYNLKVSLPGKESVTAQTTIPEEITNFDVNVFSKKLVADNSYERRGQDFKCYQTDLIFKSTTPSRYNHFYVKAEFFNSADGIPRSRKETPTFSRSYFSQAVNGKLEESVVVVKKADMNQSQLSNYSKVEYTAYLTSASEDYYKHELTMAAVDKNAEGAFVSPVRVYSNIQGGYGIFAGHNTITKRIVSTY